MGYNTMATSYNDEIEGLINWIYDEGLLNMRYWLVRKDSEKKHPRVGPWNNAKDAQLGLEAVRMVLAYWGISDEHSWVLVRDDFYKPEEAVR